MNRKVTMPQGAKIAVTVLNIVLILVGIIAMLILSIGTLSAKSTGTFGLFGNSYHLNQSEQMSPLIEKNDLVTIKKADPISFQMGDLIAYYQEENGKDFLLIRRLVGMMGSEYYLEDGSGNQTIVEAAETRFLGKAVSRSPGLGKAVQFLQSREGKKIYLWWTVSLLFLLIGVIVLLHVIFKQLRSRDDADDEEYGIEYLEAGEPAEEEDEPSPELYETYEEEPAVEDDGGDFFVDVSAFDAPEEDASPEEEPAPTIVQPASDPAPAMAEEEDDFDLARIISDIQDKLDGTEDN